VLIVPFSILILSILLQGCGPLSEQGAADDSASVNPNRFNPVLSTAFAEPWPTQVTRQELIDTALYKSFAFLDTLPNERCGVDVNFYFQDTWVQDQVDVVQTTSSGMIELLCNYLSEDVHVIGGDYDFVKETIAKNDLPRDEYGGVCGYEVSNSSGVGCAAYGVAWVGRQIGTVVGEKFVLDPKRFTTITHELFHIVHDDIDSKPGPSTPGPGEPLFRPVWLFEGAGSFWGSLIPRYFGVQDYQIFLPMDQNRLPLEVSYLSDLKTMEVWQTRAGSNENYYSGMLAHEYIAASIGLEPLLEIWVRMEEGSSFDQAFEAVTSISIEQFYEKFESMHDNLYAGEFVE